MPAAFPLPTVGADADGAITLEWYCEPRHTFSLSVGMDGILHYAGLAGEDRSWGTTRFGASIPSWMLQLIDEIVSDA